MGAIASAFAAIGSAVASSAPAITAVAATAAAGVSIASAAGAFSSKASTINPNPTPTAAQTVDTAGQTDPANPQQLGRAALVYTSGQGVQGSNPANRYALLGTSSGLS